MIEPTADKVLIIPDTAPEGTLLNPETTVHKPSTGKVYAAGPGKPGEPMQLKAGWDVLFVRGSGRLMEIEGQQMILMHEEEVIGISKK